MNADRQNRSPRVDRLPDQRLRVTTLADVLNNVPKTPAGIAAAGLWLNWGTAHDTFTNCLLIKQDISGQEGPFRKPVEEPPQLVRVFEELSPTDETQVGNPGYDIDQYDNTIVTIDWLQLSTGTATYQIPGTTTVSSPNGTAVLKTEERTDNGTLRTIRRIYTTGGHLATNEELKFGGKLLIRTLKYLNSVPPTPSGFTLVTTSIEYIRGLPLYNYGYAAGGGGGGTGTGGIISTDIVYHESSDQGTTGVTVQTIRYITDTSVVVNPISTPSGFVLIALDSETQDGYKLWTGIYAKGMGEVGRDIVYGQGWENRGEGTITTTITHLTASSVSTNPTTPPSGAVLIKIDHREADGYRIWTVIYAYGTGNVFHDTEYKEGGKLVIYTITNLGSIPSAPSPTIGGTVTQIDFEVRFADGYQIITCKWAEGFGQVSIDWNVQFSGTSQFDLTDPTDSGGLKVATIRTLTPLTTATDPSSPPAEPFVRVESSFAEQDGYRLWTSVWATGEDDSGDPWEIFADVQVKDSGKLVLYTSRALTSAPPAPSPTIGGTVVQTSENRTMREGYIVYERTWAEGKGTISLVTRPREDGSVEHNIATLSAAAELPAAPGSPGSFNYARILAGTAVYCTNLKNDAQDGYFINTATWIELLTDRSTEKRTVNFTVPGLATAANPPTFVPPISRRLFATVFEFWGTTPNPTALTPYTIENWASLIEEYKVADSGQQVSNIQALDGYVGSSTATGSNVTYRGIDVDTYVVAVGGSTPTTKPTGLTVLDVEWEPYLTDINGVVVWKTTALKFTF